MRTGYRLVNKHILYCPRCERLPFNIGQYRQNRKYWQKTQQRHNIKCDSCFQHLPESATHTHTHTPIQPKQKRNRKPTQKIYRNIIHKNRRPINFTLIRFILLCLPGCFIHARLSRNAARRAHISWIDRSLAFSILFSLVHRSRRTFVVLWLLLSISVFVEPDRFNNLPKWLKINSSEPASDSNDSLEIQWSQEIITRQLYSNRLLNV